MMGVAAKYDAFTALQKLHFQILHTQLVDRNHVTFKAVFSDHQASEIQVSKPAVRQILQIYALNSALASTPRYY